MQKILVINGILYKYNLLGRTPLLIFIRMIINNIKRLHLSKILIKNIILVCSWNFIMI